MVSIVSHIRVPQSISSKGELDFIPFVRIFDELSEGLKRTKHAGILSCGHLETTNFTRLRETHSLILGLLAEAAVRCRGASYDVLAIEHALKARGIREFQPDLTLWKLGKDEKRLVGVIEYESPNSGDRRVSKRDIKEHYHSFVQAPEEPANRPEFWLVITTLPNHTVDSQNWKNWDYPKKTGGYRTLVRNPYRFWYQVYEAEFSKHLYCCRRRSPLFIANLTSSELRICLPKDYSEKVWGIGS